jgi:hypothetical protein
MGCVSSVLKCPGAARSGVAKAEARTPISVAAHRLFYIVERSGGACQQFLGRDEDIERLKTCDANRWW